MAWGQWRGLYDRQKSRVKLPEKWHNIYYCGTSELAEYVGELCHLKGISKVAVNIWNLWAYSELLLEIHLCFTLFVPTCLQKLDRQVTAVVSGRPQGLVRLLQQRSQKYSWSLPFSLFCQSISVINSFVFSNFSCWNREKTKLKIRNPGSCLNSPFVGLSSFTFIKWSILQHQFSWDRLQAVDPRSPQKNVQTLSYTRWSSLKSCWT